MHRMTRLPEATQVRAPFDGREFHFKDDVARFERVGSARFVRLRSAKNGEHLYRVTKVIGGRYREDFAGLEVASTDPGAPVLGDPRAELILPASFVYQSGAFRLKGYSVMVGERPGMRAGGVWNQTCIFCHNTIPYFDDLWGALHGPGAPPYQGEVVDRVLPLSKQLRYGIRDSGALLAALDSEVARLGAVPGTIARAGDDDARAGLRRAMLEARARFQPQHFVEVGVGCESCHGGSREHAQHPQHRPTFEPRAPFLDVRTPGAGAPSPAEWQNRACARCHQVLFSRYARTWEGGARRSPTEAGGSHITSGEARDFLLGGCAQAMACSTCHDPHGEDRRDRLARLATPAGNGVCTGCHGQFAAADALRAHAHHDPQGAGGACIACHMPRKNMGLGYALTRYHRIGSPTDTARVEGDRPLECVMCHAEKTVGSVLDDLKRLWGKSYDEAALRRLYGSRDENVLLATIARGYPHEQATAMAIAGERKFAPALPAIIGQSHSNGYPLVRLYAGIAKDALEGRAVSDATEQLMDAHGAPAAGDADPED
jgi:predicted CXXCH cytochrome family protein